MDARTRQSVIFAIFLVSGFAALLYQVVWQRSLFAIYGINIEAVTMVVTAFMLGLGLGSLAGGRLSARPNAAPLRLFAIIEAGIGAFGLVSLPLFHFVGNATVMWPPALVMIATFALLLAPTVLMGSTLPLLVTYLLKSNKNVGRSVGTLYFVNTLGSAGAAFACVLVLLPQLGQMKTTCVAAGFNFVVSALAWKLHRSAEVADRATNKSLEIAEDNAMDDADVPANIEAGAT